MAITTRIVLHTGFVVELTQTPNLQPGTKITRTVAAARFKVGLFASRNVYIYKYMVLLEDTHTPVKATRQWLAVLEEHGIVDANVKA